MRDLILVAATLGMLPVIIRYPQAGALAWGWFSIMAPHRETYGFAAGQPFNLVIAIATLIGLATSRERKRWPPDALPWVMLGFVVWMTLNSLQVPFPDWSWPIWNLTVRIFAFVFLVFVLINNRVRIHAMIWVLVISVGFYGVKGGMFTILSGGTAIVYGPPETVLGDNNQLALAAVMTVPLILYLRDYTEDRRLRLGLLIAAGLEIVMVFGSYSRGGVIALTPMLIMVVVRSKRRAAYGIATIAVVCAGLSVMPSSFWERMQTIGDPGQDSSFHGRVVAWQVAMKYAADHFPFGAGFSAPELGPIFNHYFPDELPHAAHSIFFEVLGEHGYLGLAIFLLMLLLAARNSLIIIRQTRNQPGLRWANDLAKYLQVSLASFCIGGAALSIAYFDGYLLLLALLSTLREVTARAAMPSLSPPGSRSLAGRRLVEPGAAVQPGPRQTATSRVGLR